jgi:SAM-dependent methyltransferase
LSEFINTGKLEALPQGTMNDYQLLIDLHKHASRQGPGGDAETLQAIALAGLDSRAPQKIAVIGCGTGAAALLLAKHLNAQISAIDFLPDFLDVLNQRAEQAGVADKISTYACSMESLPFADEALDVIWSEGAIYNFGFEQGVSDWRRCLKPGGLLIASEITRNSKAIGVASIRKLAWPLPKSACSKGMAMRGLGILSCLNTVGWINTTAPCRAALQNSSTGMPTAKRRVRLSPPSSAKSNSTRGTNSLDSPTRASGARCRRRWSRRGGASR